MKVTNLFYNEIGEKFPYRFLPSEITNQSSAIGLSFDELFQFFPSKCHCKQMLIASNKLGISRLRFDEIHFYETFLLFSIPRRRLKNSKTRIHFFFHSRLKIFNFESLKNLHLI